MSQDFNEAVRYFRMAEQGHDGAQFELGEMYREAVGVAGDLNEAARYYPMAADKGCSQGIVRIGSMHND